MLGQAGIDQRDVTFARDQTPVIAASNFRIGDELMAIMRDRHGATCTRCFETAAAELNEMTPEIALQQEVAYSAMLWENVAVKKNEGKEWAKKLFDEHPQLTDPFWRELLFEAIANAEAGAVEPPPGAIVVDIERHGFGDAMNYAWIAEGDERLCFLGSGQKAELVRLFGQRVVNQYSGELADYAHTYRWELTQRGNVKRVDVRAAAIGAKVEPARPRFMGGGVQAERWARESPSMTMLFPKATRGAREWPINYWLDLYAMLDKEGQQPAFFVARGDEAQFKRSRCFAISWAHVCEAMLRARLCIGSDSGPAHVAGTLDVPFLCLVGPTIEGAGFEYTPSVHFMSTTPEVVGCVGCYWSAAYRPACDHGCEAMMLLRPREVFDRAKEMLCKPTE